jgi:phage terminase large subunit-like protein
MNMCVNNAICTADDAGNRKPSKEKANGRIDLVVAAVMAAAMTMKTENASHETLFYDLNQ